MLKLVFRTKNMQYYPKQRKTVIHFLVVKTRLVLMTERGESDFYLCLNICYI